MLLLVLLLDVFLFMYYGITLLAWSGNMAMSVRLDPTLENRVAQESRRLGITKSEFVKDAVDDHHHARFDAKVRELSVGGLRLITT